MKLYNLSVECENYGVKLSFHIHGVGCSKLNSVILDLGQLKYRCGEIESEHLDYHSLDENINSVDIQVHNAPLPIHLDADFLSDAEKQMLLIDKNYSMDKNEFIKVSWSLGMLDQYLMFLNPYMSMFEFEVKKCVVTREFVPLTMVGDNSNLNLATPGVIGEGDGLNVDIENALYAFKNGKVCVDKETILSCLVSLFNQRKDMRDSAQPDDVFKSSYGYYEGKLDMLLSIIGLDWSADKMDLSYNEWVEQIFGMLLDGVNE